MLQVFKSLPVADRIHRAEALPASARAYRRDTITLGWEDRLKSRGRRRSDGGLEFGTALARGTTLRAGDAFILDAAAIVVEVAERPEAVLVIEPRTPVEWGLFAYCIGNSHQPLMFTADAIVCPDVTGMEQVLSYHAIPFARATRAFTPASPGGALGAGHQHPPERVR